jgi:hypothetical protein
LTGPSQPLHDTGVVDALGTDLRAAGYTTDGVSELLGEQAHAALGRGVWWPALRATRAADPEPLAVLVRLFLLGADEPGDRVERALPTAGLEGLLANGVVEATGQGTVRAVLDIRPHGDGAREFVVASD